MKIMHFFRECRRVVKVTKKPNIEEFSMIVKVSSFGLFVIGVIGFFISMSVVVFK